MQIKRIEIGKVKIPLRKPFITALRRVDFAEDIIIKIITDTGKLVLGNAPPTAVITGDSQDSIISAISQVIAPQLINKDVSELETICKIIDKSMLHILQLRLLLILLFMIYLRKCVICLYINYWAIIVSKLLQI